MRSEGERTIQTALGISSPSVVHNMLRRLEGRELLRITRYGHGVGVDLALTEAGQEALRTWRAERSHEEQT